MGKINKKHKSGTFKNGKKNGKDNDDFVNFWKNHLVFFYLKQSILIILEIGFLAISIAALVVDFDDHCYSRSRPDFNLATYFHRAISLMIAGHVIQIIKLSYGFHSIKVKTKESLLKCCLSCGCCYSLGVYIYI